MEMNVESIQQLNAMGFFFENKGPHVLNRLEELIQEREFSIVDIASVVGVSRQTIDSFVSNRSSPNLQLGLKIAHIFGMPVEDIFYLTDSAWIETAKDGDRRTFYFDRLQYKMLSGPHMKPYDKFEHVNLATGETISSQLFKSKVKAAEEEAAERYQKQNPISAKRDEIARVKEEARNKVEEEYPPRFEVLYRNVEPIVLPK